MRDNRKRPGARRGLVVLTACVLAGITPVTAFAAKRPDDNLSDVEAPRPDVNKDLSPEFAYSEDKWASLRDNVMEYGELADLIHEYNPVVRSNRESYNDMRGKTLNDVYQEAMDAAQDLWDQAGDSDDDSMRATLNMQGNTLAKSADDLFEDPEMQKISYDQAEAGLVSQAQQLMITYQQSGYTMENLQNTRNLLQSKYEAAVALMGTGSSTQVEVLNAQKSVQDQDAAILSTQKSIDSVHRTLCLMTGWAADAQPEIRTVPEPDLARIDAINPEADQETALKNNYTIRYNEKKLGNLSASTQIEATKATIEDARNNVINGLKTQYNTILTTRDSLTTAQLQLQLAQVDLEKAAASLAVGSSTQLQYQSAENAFITAKNTVETTKLQLLLAMENYDWIVKGLVASK